jgi:putative flippase GtrA
MIEKIKALFQDQRLRFLIVGGINTLVGYSLFVLFEHLFAGRFGQFGYMVSLISSYAIAMIIAFILHRKFVFKVHGKLLLDFGRFVLSNMVGFGLNAVILPVMVTLTGKAPVIAQAITAVIVAIAAYFMHKYFSFRRTRAPVADESK